MSTSIQNLFVCIYSKSCKRWRAWSCGTDSGATSVGPPSRLSAKWTSRASRRGLTLSCFSRPSRTSTRGRWERRRPAGGGRWSRGKRWEGSGSDPQTRSAWSGPPPYVRGRAERESLERRGGQGWTAQARNAWNQEVKKSGKDTVVNADAVVPGGQAVGELLTRAV